MKIKRPYFDLNYPSTDNKKENRIASILNNKNEKSFTETIFLEKEKLKKEIIKKEQETSNNFEEKEKKINFLRKPVIVFQNDDIINNLNNENYDLLSNSEEPTIYNFSDSNDESDKINYLEFKISDKKIEELSFVDFLKEKKFYCTSENRILILNKLFGILHHHYIKYLLKYNISLENNFKKNSDLNYFSFISRNFNSLKKQNLSELFYFISQKEKNETYNQLLDKSKKNFLISPFILSKNDFEKIYHIKQNYFEFFRYIYSENGDSFYIAFIFSLFETIILKNNIQLFSILIYDIFRLQEIKEIYYNLNIKKTMIIFNIIYDFMKINNINQAYEIFLFSFENQNDFEQVLIRYLRYCIYGYLNNLNFEKKKINYSSVCIYYNEPSKFVIQSLIKIFNINIKVVFIEGNMEKFKEIEFLNSNNNIDLIKIGYFYNNFHIIYQDKLEINDKFYRSDLSEILCGFFSEEKIIKCSICKNNNFINLYKFKYSICSNCLEKIINEVLEKRFNCFLKDNLINYSYYMRPILLSNNPEIKITDTDCINLFNFSFSKIWGKKIKNLCFFCYQFQKNVISIKCECQYCTNCLMQKLYSITNNNIILNGFEKIKNLKCECGIDIDLKEIINKIEIRDLEKKEQEAKKRMNHLINNYCCFCLRKINKIVIDNFINVSIPEDLINSKLIKNLDYKEINHLICLDCKINYEMNNKKKDKKIMLFCQICQLNHLFENTQIKTNSDKSKLCNIF